MSIRWNRNQHLAASWFATLLVLAVFSSAKGYGAQVGCLPSTPCPFAADGICRPSQESFGYRPTRWRRWPGDPRPELPTLPEEQITEEEMKLKPFEHPTPEEEDVREPAKTESFTPPEESSPQALPEENLIPGLDPQGSILAPELEFQSSIPASPRQEDAPPELPRKLRRFVSASQIEHLSMLQAPPSSQLGQLGRSASNDRSRQPSSSQSRPQMRSQVVQVAAEQRVRKSSAHLQGLNLTNPAARVSVAIMGPETRNQQAIYYQTVDRTVPH